MYAFFENIIHCSIVGMTVGGVHGAQKNQLKIIFDNHLRSLDSVGQV